MNGRPDPTNGKQAGQSYVEALGYSIPKVFSHFDSITDLPDLVKLPTNFVLKPVYGHSSKNVFLMKDGVNLFNGRNYSRDDIVAEVIQEDGPFLIEELLENHDGSPGIPLDYKFYCFGRDIAFIHVIQRNSALDISRNRHWFLTEDWSHLRIKVKKMEAAERSIPTKPDFLPDMLSMAQNLGGHLNAFMRIDLYATERGAVFGEFTPFPNHGRGYTPESDAWLGSLWRGVEGAGD
jgi:hypothetical protein